MKNTNTVDASGMPVWHPITFLVSARDSTQKALVHIEDLAGSVGGIKDHLRAAERELEQALSAVKHLQKTVE